MPSSVNRLFFMGSSPLGRKPFSQVTDGSKNPGRSLCVFRPIVTGRFGIVTAHSGRL